MTTVNSILLFVALLAAASACSPDEKLQELERMSVVDNYDKISVEIENYRPRSGMKLQHFFVSNFSLFLRGNSIYESAARDGLGDSEKSALFPTHGITSLDPESRFFGVSDLFLVRTFSVPPAIFPCSAGMDQNSSFDGLTYNDDRYTGSPQKFLGLRDCVKTNMNLDRYRFDNDSDGIPDYFELRCGTNPLDPYDADSSASSDIANIEKCKRNIPVSESSRSITNSAYAYIYDIQAPVMGTQRIKISNISVSDGGLQNFIAFYVVEKSLTTNEMSLTTAFMIPKSPDYSGQNILLDYWGGGPLFNQEIVLP